MALSSRTRLGPYEVAAQIGVGGMGEVYRATDVKLKRQVALKILPESVAADPDRLARFQREAEVLASLNHPNIAAIYGMEEGPADAEHHMRALVMELVEGPTLADRIAQGAIPIDEALPVATQIAEALEAAHEQGIVHRDLKPANIKVRPDGTVKVLDFGLAKAMEPVAATSASVSMSPTITSPAMTRAGMILGTAAYMSPEQARGKFVDRRADIWAFGAVLFEMLTAQRAFPGADLTDTISAVVKLDPKWDAVGADVPARVRQVLRVCLQKDPRQRAQAIGDVRLALEGAFETAAPRTATLPSMPLRRMAWVAFAVALIAVAVFVGVVRSLRETPPPAPPETRLDIVTPVTDRPESFALSPDGRQIVFVASSDGESRLWLRSLATTTARPLVGTGGAMAPFWSPDGRAVGFFAAGALKRIDVSGSPDAVPQTLAPALNGAGATWNTDGVIVFAPSLTTPLMRVSASGGAATAVAALGPQQQGHIGPHFLPDGHRILFYARGTPETAGIYLGALDESRSTRLTSADSIGVYLPAGWLLWVREGTHTLVAQRLDIEKAVLTGEPVTLADGMAVDDSFYWSAVSVAATGLVAYRTGAVTTRQLTWVDRSGKALVTVDAADASLRNPHVAPDGRRVVVARAVQGNMDLWLLDGTRTSRVTFDAAGDQFPVWSPDGNRIVFSSTRTGPFDIYLKLTNGAGAEDRLVASAQAKVPSSWSADGRFLLYMSNDPQTNGDLWVMPMAGDRTPSVFLKTPFREAYAVFSPDGKWVAYHSNESGRAEVYVRPFVAPGATGTAGVQWQVSTSGGVFPAWRPDGKELYYLNPAGAMMAAPVTVTAGTFEPGASGVLFPTRIVSGGVDRQLGWQYDVAPDGRFLINTELDSAAAPITLLQNWHPEAKK